MKICNAFVFLLFSIVSIFASGRNEPPQEYIDIGQLDLTQNRLFANINLPYQIPDNVDRIIEQDIYNLSISKLIVDGRIINPKKIYWDAAGRPEPRSLNISADDGQHTVSMHWRAWGSNGTYDDRLSEGIYYEGFSRNLNRFIIPYGSNEVFIFYQIRFVDKSNNYIISDRQYIVKFNIIWPEIRIADKHGRINPPDNFVHLGTYRVNSNNEMIIELPFQELNEIFNHFNPFIDYRWIKIYQMISDEILINEQRLTLNERNNIQALVRHNGVREVERTIEMKWLLSENPENGLSFYSISENPPIKYVISYGTREVYMIYDILFNSSVGYSNYNKRLCVKWEIEWN